MKQILIVEDESIIRSALRKLLEKHRYAVSDAESVDQALELYQLDDYNLIITDVRLPGRPGTDLIELAKNTPVLVMTSYASMRSAVDAMKQGAVDYIAKPFDHDQMLSTVNQIVSEHSATAAHNTAPAPTTRANGDTQRAPTRMLGSSQTMQELHTRIQKVARTDATVLIQGESGTGKELAARSIHELSNRNSATMICVNCAAIPQTLIESELFGHEKGAFTGAVNAHSGLIEAANGGTLFLDEIGELPLEAQARLLRVLQEGEIRKVGSVKPMQVDIRLIAATHRDLKALTRNGQFREDLFYRLYIMEIRMPPLRERGSDIVFLAEKFLLRNCERMDHPPMQLSERAKQTLLNYGWPGNVRELENAVERAVILSETSIVEPECFGLDMVRAGSEEEHTNPIPADLSLEDYFQQFVLENQDRMTETDLAKKLGISRKTLWERRQRLGIPRKSKNDIRH